MTSASATRVMEQQCSMAARINFDGDVRSADEPADILRVPYPDVRARRLPDQKPGPGTKKCPNVPGLIRKAS